VYQVLADAAGEELGNRTPSAPTRHDQVDLIALGGLDQNCTGSALPEDLAIADTRLLQRGAH